MSQQTLERALPVGDRVLLDTSTIVAYFNAAETVYPVASYLIDNLVEPGRNAAIVSMITIMEVLIRPLRRSPGPEYRHMLDFLTRFPNLRPTEIDLPVAQEAASLRAAFRFSTPDALIVASGLVSQVGHLVTNDATWASRLQPLASRIRVCLLANHLPFP